MRFSEKYQVIRKRFFDDFYHEGSIGDRINLDNTELKFGDQTIYMGLALLCLATEVPIRRDLGLDPEESIRPITEILDTIDRLDDEAEAFYGAASIRDGFILRDNFKSIDDPRLKRRWSKLISDGQSLSKNSPSADQIFGILYGLWFVKRYSGSDQLTARCEELADRLYRYAMRSRFMLKLPDGKPTHRGADMWWLSSLMHGLAFNVSGVDHFDESKFDLLELLRGAPGGVTVIPEEVDKTVRKVLDSAIGRVLFPEPVLGLQGIASFWDNAGRDAAAVLGAELQMPILPDSLGLPALSGLTIKVKSFSAHIILMAIATSNMWMQEEFEKAAVASSHQFSILWYALAHEVMPLKVTKQQIESLLASCPDEGPMTGLPVETGWQTDHRWIRCTNLKEPTNPGYRYAGLDFMMLHNLSELVYG
jgi:hypothetical protein